jgi:hypothetical protein
MKRGRKFRNRRLALDAHFLLPAAAEVTSMAPSLTRNRTGERICAPFCIDRIFLNHRIFLNDRIVLNDRIFLNHHSRSLHNDGPANHDCLGNYRSPLLDDDARLRPVLERLNFPRVNFPRANLPLMAGNFGITSNRQIRGHCR